MGIGIKTRLRRFTFDEGTFTKAVEKEATSAVYNAAREWLSEVITHVPIWTGQSLGSLKYAQGRTGVSAGLFLGEYLKLAIPIPAPHPKPNKNALTGGPQGRFTFSQSKHQFRFTYQTDVIYYVIQDFFFIHVSPRAPWLSMEFGANSFEFALRSEMADRLPKVAKFLLDSEVIS